MNSGRRILFLSWKNDVSKFEYYSPSIQTGDYSGKGSNNNKFTKTVFIPKSETAVTGTDNGEILVFDRSLIIEGIGEADQKRLIKIVTLTAKTSINQLMTIDNKYLVVGNSDGNIRFYDFQFKVAAWFENLKLYSIKSISFSTKDPVYAAAPEDQTDSKNDFACSDFIVADATAQVCQLKSSIFEAIDPQKDKTEQLLHGLQSSITAIAVHPKPETPYLAIAGSDGFIIIWDYINKKNVSFQFEEYGKEKKSGDKKSDSADQKLYTVMEFTPDGTELLVGQRDGAIKVFDPNTGKQKKMSQPLTCSYDKYPSIKHLVVSEDGKYFATSDSDKGVSLFKKDSSIIGNDQQAEWVFNGKIRSHDVEITGLCFGNSIDENDQPINRLFSIGADRECFEYDVKGAKLSTMLPVLHHFKVEMEAKPTALIWYPTIDFNEGLILTTNDEYKMKLWNPKLGNSRRTALGPTYGGEITKLKLLNVTNESTGKYLVYSTNKKVIGLIKLPMDGNPNKTMGLIAHPNEVSDICCSKDGKYVFTCGGKDLAVNMWKVNVAPIEQAIAMGGDGIEPFINLIEGGRQGQTFTDMQDFFYYSIIRSKSENTTKTRELKHKQVPIEELPNLMRAMGFYPTEQEVKNIKDEVKYSEYTERAIPTTHVTLERFITLFVNHRPVYGIGK